MTAQEVNFSNFFETTLNGIVASSATAMTLTAAPTSDGSNNISAPYYLVIDPDSSTQREVIKVTASSGTSITAMTRDIEGRHSTDPNHADGTTVRMAVIKEMFEDIHDRIDSGIVNKNYLRNGNFLSDAFALETPSSGQVIPATTWTKIQSVDSWWYYAGNSGTTITSPNHAFNDIDNRAFNDPHRLLKLSSTNSYSTSYLYQVVEAPELFYRRQLTLSGYMRSTTADKPRIQGDIAFDYDSAIGIGGVTSGGAGPFGTAVTPTSSWTKFSFTTTFDPGSYGSGSNSSSMGPEAFIKFGLRITQSSGTGGDIELTGLKLEQGDTGTPNAENKIEEIEKCKKWYQVIGARRGEGDITIATGRATSTTEFEVYMPVDIAYTPYWNIADFSVLNTVVVRGASNTDDITSLTFNKPNAGTGKHAYPGMIKITGTAGSGTFTAGEFVNLETKTSSSASSGIEIDFEGPHF
jgi:hypothetical protein